MRSIRISTSDRPLRNADAALCAVCNRIYGAWDFEAKHLRKCKLKNPDKIPPFACSGAGGHMFKTAMALHLHELHCPALDDLKEAFFGPRHHVVMGNVRAPSPTNLVPSEIWSEEEPDANSRPQLQPTSDDARDAYMEKFWASLESLPRNCPILKG